MRSLDIQITVLKSLFLQEGQSHCLDQNSSENEIREEDSSFGVGGSYRSRKTIGSKNQIKKKRCLDKVNKFYDEFTEFTVIMLNFY